MNLIITCFHFNSKNSIIVWTKCHHVKLNLKITTYAYSFWDSFVFTCLELSIEDFSKYGVAKKELKAKRSIKNWSFLQKVSEIHCDLSNIYTYLQLCLSWRRRFTSRGWMTSHSNVSSNFCGIKDVNWRHWLIQWLKDVCHNFAYVIWCFARIVTNWRTLNHWFTRNNFYMTS